MIILPAIDLCEGKAVRLFNGDYAQKTVYSESPVSVALDFKKQGATWIHLVDLDGAKSGETPNFCAISEIKAKTGLLCETGGGIRNIETVERYLNAGIDRVIIGTAAVKDPEFLKAAVSKYNEKIAVGIDIKNGFVAVNGWLETTEITLFDFLNKMTEIGVKTVICTDISKDGAMKGTNLELYKNLANFKGVNIIASGGVSSMEDVKALKNIGVYGAIIGKAYYTGAVSLKDAIEVAK